MNKKNSQLPKISVNILPMVRYFACVERSNFGRLDLIIVKNFAAISELKQKFGERGGGG